MEMGRGEDIKHSEGIFSIIHVKARTRKRAFPWSLYSGSAKGAHLFGITFSAASLGNRPTYSVLEFHNSSSSSFRKCQGLLDSMSYISN